MRQPYLKHLTRTESATPTYYTNDDRVEPGKILVIRSLCVNWSGMKTTETGQFFIETGQGRVFLGDDVPAKQDGHAYVGGQFFVGEGQRVGVYTPDSASADVIYFDIVGELWDLKDWMNK
jgi:hypothetical protein